MSRCGGLLIPIRRFFQQYVNLRPVRLFEGIDSPLKKRKPDDIDFIIVRENNEGEYSNIGGRIYEGKLLSGGQLFDFSLVDACRAGAARFFSGTVMLPQSAEINGSPAREWLPFLQENRNRSHGQLD